MKKCYILQPGKIGDVIIVLPIAKYYADRGYDVYWFVYEDYLQMFEYVDYVKPIPIFCGSLIPEGIKDFMGLDIVFSVKAGALGTYYKIEHEVSLSQEDLVIDLSIGFSESKVNAEWKNSGLSFDKWKYAKAGVPFSEKYKLVIKEKPKKEKLLGLTIANPDGPFAGIHIGGSYSVTHSAGEMGNFKFNIVDKKSNVEVKKVKGFTIFDWIDILRHANKISCVDSCVANLVNQLGFCKGKRTFKSWGNKLTEPKMESDWIVV